MQAKAVHGRVGCHQNYEQMSRKWCRIWRALSEGAPDCGQLSFVLCFSCFCEIRPETVKPQVFVD